MNPITSTQDLVSGKRSYRYADMERTGALFYPDKYCGPEAKYFKSKK
jgi:hypothetical protein